MRSSIQRAGLGVVVTVAVPVATGTVKAGGT